jgi:carboxyl-terminal processing protease
MLVAVLLAALFALGWWSGRDGGRGELYANVDKFVEVLHKVDENYVEPVEPQKLIHGAIDGMLQTLDPYSQYLDVREYTGLQDVTRGAFTGVGIEVGLRDHYPTVITPIEGSPAWEAGIQTGDVIVRVDGKPTTDFSLDDVADALRGPRNTHVTVEVTREGDTDERKFDLTRREITVASVPYAFVTGEGVGYVRLARFSEDTDAGLQKAIAQLKTAGAKSLVIDLRKNPGGLLEQAGRRRAGVRAQGLAGRVDARPHRELDASLHRAGQQARDGVADGGARRRGQRLGVRDRRGRAAGPRSRARRGPHLVRQGLGAGAVSAAWPGRRGEADDGALLHAERALDPSRRPSDELDPLADDSDDESDDDSTTAVAPLKADTVALPIFHTLAGRVVRGGGGITPDIEVKADTLGPVAFNFERRGLAVRFARRWNEAHGAQAPLPTQAEVWPELARFLESESVRPPADSLELERPAPRRARAPRDRAEARR